MGSGGVKDTFCNHEGNKFYGDKGDKISNNSTDIINNAIANTNKQGRRFVRRHPGGFIVTGNQVSYC